VVLFTLLVQGLTTKFLMDRLQLLNDEELQQRYLKLVAQRDVLEKVLAHLLNPARKPLIASDQFQHQLEGVTTSLDQTIQELDSLRQANPLLEDLILQQHREQLTAIESATYVDFVQRGLLKEMPPSVLDRAFEG
jgi:CPA1 family monovalent cation:H+ antiporter